MYDRTDPVVQVDVLVEYFNLRSRFGIWCRVELFFSHKAMSFSSGRHPFGRNRYSVEAAQCACKDWKRDLPKEHSIERSVVPICRAF
jgi:hypothetical protein